MYSNKIYTNWSFEISQKNYFQYLWRNYEVIMTSWLCNFPYFGAKLKFCISRTMLATKFVYLSLASSTRWFIFRMDILVSDWEILGLKSTKIPEKSEKLEFFVGGSKNLNLWKMYIFYIKIVKISNLVKFHQNICIFKDFKAISFLCVFYKDLTRN